MEKKRALHGQKKHELYHCHSVTWNCADAYNVLRRYDLCNLDSWPQAMKVPVCTHILVYFSAINSQTDCVTANNTIHRSLLIYINKTYFPDEVNSWPVNSLHWELLKVNNKCNTFYTSTFLRVTIRDFDTSRSMFEQSKTVPEWKLQHRAWNTAQLDTWSASWYHPPSLNSVFL